MILSAIIILIVALGVCLAVSQKLRSIHIQKHIRINSSIEEVFNQVVLLKNFPNWSPFLEADPTLKVEVKGTDGKVGAQYHWLGNKGKDVGYQEIKEIRPLAYIKMGCDIQKPFTAKPIFEYTFEQVGSEVKVTQDFYLESGGVDAFFMWLFNIKKNMEKMNQRGLVLLKVAAEK